MGKNELIQNISLATSIPRATCEQVIDAFRDEIQNSLVQGEKVMIKDFMSIEIGERSERDARNPKTGEIERFPAVKTVKVKVCKKIKDAVNCKEES